MRNLFTKLKKARYTKKSALPWGGLFLFLVVIVLGAINYKSGTILTGWDNLHPEYAFDINIKRSLFAVWQEYQGLGLLGGMGHASDLIRQLALLLLSVVMPMEFLRYFATIATLFIGSIGSYVLIKSLIPYENGRKEIFSTVGALFYLLNIATIQAYFVAFEAFTAHYAALPWLLFGALAFIKFHNKKYFLLFTIIILLATPSAYIPTLFVAFLISLTILLGGLLLFAKNRMSLLKKTIQAYSLIFFVNAFWLLPFLYFTLTSSSVNVDAKMNQMATEAIFQQNKEYGDLKSVIKLQGFWFSNVDPNLQGNFRYMLGPWMEHFKNPYVTAFSYLIFGVIIAGAAHVIKNKRPLHLAFLLLLLFSFTMLATDAFPFSWFVDLFRSVPLFGQAFRFPFTKFAILTSLMYSIFFSLGLIVIANQLKRITAKFSMPIVALAAAILIGTISYPAFRGNLFYDKEQIKLPNEYYQTFEFFKNQDQNSRIANFPQHTFWGWNFYKWGYGGSGFLWYGIKQPILDRAFDVWSDELENYYFEISTTLYQKDPQKVAQILEKYQIKWLLIDQSIYSPFSPKATFMDEAQDVFSKIPNVKKARQFGSITIYSVNLQNEPDKYLFTTPRLPSANKYTWGSDDQVYRAIGNYAAKNDNHTFYFPFRSLFSNRTSKDLEFKSIVSHDSISFKANLPEITSEKVLTLPSYVESEAFLPAEYMTEQKNGETVFSIRLLVPTVTVNTTTITRPTLTIPVFIIPNSIGTKFTLVNNGFKKFEVDTQKPFSQKTYLSLTQDNVITLKNALTGEVLVNIIPSQYLASASLLPTAYKITPGDSGKVISVTFPKIDDDYFGYNFASTQFPKAYDCNAFRKGVVGQQHSGDKKTLTLTTVNDTLCTSVLTPTLSHSMAYLISLDTSNISGRPFHFWAQNADQQYAPIDTYLLPDDTNTDLVLLPMEKFGQGYSFHFENVSIGNEMTQNRLNNIGVYPIPYTFLTGISYSAPFTPQPNDATFTSDHPNESLYLVKNIKAQNPFTLILSQSYDAGWKAYALEESKFSAVAKLQRALPFIFGKEIKPHVKVNNWQNGWEITDPRMIKDKQLIIVYLPQYLQYIGFLLMGIPFVLLLLPHLGFILQGYKRFDTYFEAKTRHLKLSHKR